MNLFNHQHILTTKQFNRTDLDLLFETAKSMEENKFSKKQGSLLNGKVLATLFFEPSTRSRLSFESAMKRLGGSVISVSGTSTTSMSKGETIEDTSRIVSGYADIMVIRHPEIGSAKRLASVASVPVINGGDGINQHPTQALLDVYTIYKEKGRLDNLKIAIVGDLKYGRTTHSLIFLLGLYKNNEFVFISPEELKMPDKVISFLKKKKIKYSHTQYYKKGIKDCDIIYVTRIQKERFTDFSEYERLKDDFILTNDILKFAKKDVTIMHPLPRINEIDTKIDKNPNAVYFRQAHNGIPIRMALLYLMLQK